MVTLTSHFKRSKKRVPELLSASFRGNEPRADLSPLTVLRKTFFNRNNFLAFNVKSITKLPVNRNGDKTIALREHKTLNANRRSLDPSKILLELCLEKCVASCHKSDHEHNQNGGTLVTLENKKRKL